MGRGSGPEQLHEEQRSLTGSAVAQGLRGGSPRPLTLGRCAKPSQGVVVHDQVPPFPPSLGGVLAAAVVDAGENRQLFGHALVPRIDGQERDQDRRGIRHSLFGQEQSRLPARAAVLRAHDTKELGPGGFADAQ